MLPICKSKCQFHSKRVKSHFVQNVQQHLASPHVTVSFPCKGIVYGVCVCGGGGVGGGDIPQSLSKNRKVGQK